MFLRLFLILLIPFNLSCSDKRTDSRPEIVERKEIIVGAEQIDKLIPILQNKKVGLIVNHTSLVKNHHLVDTLLTYDINIVKIFPPEHGFRGTADAGENVDNSVDPKTGIEILSLYGSKKKPNPEDLKEVDILVYDLQDVGTRFFTYLSTLHYIMEASVESRTPVIVLDRPNPNGHYIDGPVLEPEFESFVGMHPIPVVHGCTLGELAGMINGEGWLEKGTQCDLTVIPILNYTHKTRYNLPVKPSPNLPTMNSIGHYPSLCFFEGTTMSIGRGTYHPFEVIGYPDSTFGKFSFTPVSIDGMSRYPKYEDRDCFGEDLRNTTAQEKIDLNYIIKYYERFDSPDEFFNSYFDVLAGTENLRNQIIKGMNENDIRSSWKDDLENYKNTRSKYVLYPD